MRVALYKRVSTIKQTNINQSVRLVEYAKSKGWDYDEFDEVESSRKSRPIKQKLLSLLRQGEYDAVVIFKLDRWARSSTELILEAKELIDKGIAFISISDNLDFSTASGKLHFQILSAFAEFERSLISERTKEGIIRAKSQGKTLGRPKGSKDKVKRSNKAYLMRELKKRKQSDEEKGIFLPTSDYIK
ncbi:recombinase family protein [Flavobacteriales bacterium]|nr:recombinase family protein [Flavobacteriales bacterium]